MMANDITAKETTPPPDDYRKKSLDLTVDSLKLYITLSTFAFGGLLVMLNANKQPVHTWLCNLSLSAFILCCIVSVFTINGFINQTYDGAMDPMAKGMRGKNFIAISLFTAGMISGTLFITMQKPTTIDPSISTIRITNGVLEINGNLNTEYEIKTDSINHLKTFFIKLKQR